MLLHTFRNLLPLLLITAAPAAFAHEGHGNSVLHAFLHLLQDPLHLIGLFGIAALVLAVWFYRKGVKK